MARPMRWAAPVTRAARGYSLGWTTGRLASLMAATMQEPPGANKRDLAVESV